jgi:hypothetical protein
LLFTLVHSGPILPELVEGGNRQYLLVVWRFCPLAKTVGGGSGRAARQCASSSAIPGQTGPEEASAGQKPAFNLNSAVEQQRHEDAKVGNKKIYGISPKSEAFTWQVTQTTLRTCRCSASSSRLRAFVVHIQLRDLGSNRSGKQRLSVGYPPAAPGSRF